MSEPNRDNPIENQTDERLAKRMSYDVIEPVGWRVVIRKDENKRETKSGIVLPDSHQIPVITGRVVAISKEIESDEERAIKQYDKVLFDPREAVPVELEHDNKLYVVDLEKVLAIFRKQQDVEPDKPAGNAADMRDNIGDNADDMDGDDDE